MKLNAARYINTNTINKCNCAVVRGIIDGKIFLVIYSTKKIDADS